MTTAYSAALRLGKPEVGADEDTWGTILDAMVDMIDEAVGGYVSIALAGANVTLTANNNATDQARNAVLKFTGTPGATRTVTAPDVEKTYWVYNATTDGSSLTFKSGAGTSVTLLNGAIASVYCDGATNTVALYNSQANLGIGMTPVNPLDISYSFAGSALGRLYNSSGNAAALAGWQLKNSANSLGGISLTGGSYTTAGVYRQDGTVIDSSGAGGLTLNTTVNQPVYVGVNNTEVAQFTSAKFYSEVALHIKPGSSVTPANNGDVTFELTSNTTLTIKAKGSDGTVRSGTVTLS